MTPGKGKGKGMINFLRRVLALVKKELLAVLKDPSSRFILFAPAVVYGLLYGYAATYDLNHVPYAVLDSSHSPLSAELLSRVDGTGVFRRVATVVTPAQVREVIDSQQALLVIQIGPRFEVELLAGEAATIQLILDARNSTTANTAAAYVGAIVDAFNAEQQQRRGAPGPILNVELRAWYNPNLETRWNFMPALIATLSMLQTILLSALSVAREREQGTFDQLLVTPMSPTEILIGKALPPVMIGLIQSTLVLLVTRFWFQVPMAGSLLTLYVGLTVFTIAGVGIGLSISALVATMQQAMLYTFVLMMPMFLLSGLTTPVANMPKALQLATLANPMRFGIDLARRVYLEGVGVGAIAADLVPLLAIAAISLPAAAWLFRNRLL